MKKGTITFLVAILLFTNHPFLHAQNHARSFTRASAALDINDVSSPFKVNGIFFRDDTSLIYHVPKLASPEVSTIFTGSLWIGGVDNAGQLHVAAETYVQTGNDYWPGPLDSSGNAMDSIDYNYIWKIKAADITGFQIAFHNSGGTLTQGQVPASIWNWPGRGNTHAYGGNGTFTVTNNRDMAPYFDYNNNGIYDPEHGDYPIIKGDEALWWIYNDNGYNYSTSLRFEIKAMAYAHATGDTTLDNTIYLSFNIANHSSLFYDSLYLGLWVDPDIGCNSNDYIGCDSVCNYFFGYNGAATDPDCGETGYGNSPPVQTFQFLNRPMHTFMYYNNDFSVHGNPHNAAGYYNYLRAKWLDSTSITKDHCTGYGGSVPGNYMFPGNPASHLPYPQNWSEASCGNPVGDRRGLGSVGPITFLPGQELNFDMALTTILGVGGDTLVNTDSICSRLSIVTQTYQQDTVAVPSGISHVQTTSSISVYPNPNNGSFTIALGNNHEPGATLSVFDMIGHEVYAVTQPTGNVIVKLEEKGLYIIRYTSAGNSVTRKVVVQ